MRSWRIVIFLCIFCFSSIASADDIYISQSGGGSLPYTGGCADSGSLAWFNTDGSWGGGTTSTIDAGDTVHVCGQITGLLTFMGSGTAENRITLLMEDGAQFKHTHQTHNSNWIYLGSNGGITIDGGTDGNWDMELTDVGTALPYQVHVTGIRSNGGSDVTIQNFKIRNMYQRTPGSETDWNDMGYGIQADHNNNLIIQDCTINNTVNSIGIDWSGGTYGTMIVRRNNMNQFNHAISGGGSGNLTSLAIHDNVMNAGDQYHSALGDPPNPFHIDGIFLFNESFTGRVETLKFYNNIIGPDTPTHCTAPLFYIYYLESQVGHAYVFNNVVISTNGAWTGGDVAVPWAEAYNNTLYGPGIALNGVKIAKNNLVMNNGSAFISEGNSEIYTEESDYNLYYGNTGNGGYVNLFRIGFTGASGAFTEGETINFSSGGSARHIDTSGGNIFRVRKPTGNINPGDTATGASSGKTATLTLANTEEIEYTITSVSGTFTADEEVTFSSGGSANFSRIVVGAETRLYFKFINGTVAYNATVTGTSSGATAQLNDYPHREQLPQAGWSWWTQSKVNNPPYEQNSQTGAANFVNAATGNFRLTATNPYVIGKGANLTSKCTDVPELCFDADGVARPAVGNWDIGAYQYSAGTTPPSATGCTISGGTFK